MAELDIAKEVVNYRNRFLREVIFDLVTRFGKDGIMHILRDIKTDETPKDIGDVFVSQEDDGSQWVQLDDYNNLRMAFLFSNLSLEKQIKINSSLIKKQQDLFFEDDYIVKMFMKAWRQEDYNDYDKLPDWMEMDQEQFTDVLHRFAYILTARNSKLGTDEK